MSSNQEGKSQCCSQRQRYKHGRTIGGSKLIQQQTAQNGRHDITEIIEAYRSEIGTFPFWLGNPVDQHIHHCEEQHFTNRKQHNAEHQ
ncbi:hypothetical protein D3C81_1616560 [compost metagenome]